MKRGKILSVGTLVIGLLVFSSCEKEEAKPVGQTDGETVRRITMGTGETGGLSHLTGVSIAKIAGQRLEKLGFRIDVRATSGSVFNLNAVRAGEMELAVVSSDKLYEATRGLAEWENQEPQTEVLAVFTIHPESVTLVAAEGAGIRAVADLKGKRVNLGKAGSRQRRDAIQVLEDAGFDIETDLAYAGAEAEEAWGMLQEGRIDALFFTTEHPNAFVTQATTGTRKVRFVPITDVRRLLLRFPYYVRTLIPVAMYPGTGNTDDVPTVGIKTALVASANVPSKVISAILEEVFDRIDAFNALHPGYRALTKRDMTDGMFRMIHQGALTYYMTNGYRLSCCF